MQQTLKELRSNIDVRKNSAKLKKLVQENENIELDIKLLSMLLENEDWKVRKNICNVMKIQVRKEYIPILLNQYKKENNYIVKVEVIDALCNYPIAYVSDAFMKIKDELMQIEDEINDRHIQTMISAIASKLVGEGLLAKPVFTNLNGDANVVLTCLPCNQDLLYNRITLPKKQVKLGVMVKLDDIAQLSSYRDYEDILFVLKNFKDVPFDYNAISDAVVNSNLLALLDNMHERIGSYLFRVDTSNIDPARLKNEFVQKLSMAIQSKTKKRLINSPSNYSIELQLRMMKDDHVRIFLKLYTYEDPRFKYRVMSNSTSMNPYIAASIIQIIKPYLKDKADVLDLCCGTGTLLIERCFEQRVHFIIGNDIYNKAIEAARYNTHITRMDINYVNRDYKDFKHPHLFDEILSDLPVSSANITYEMLERSYQDFMSTAAKLLKQDGYLFVYTTEHKTLRKVLRFNRDAFAIEEEIHIPLKNTEAILFIAKRK